MELEHDVQYYLDRAKNSVFKAKLTASIEMLQKAQSLAMMYDKEDGFYLAFSAGKDSQALFHVAQLAGVKFKAHMNLTSVDPPEVIRFAKHSYPEVELIKPKDSIFNIAVKKGILPTQKVRWCCAEYKESAGAGKVTLIGIRHQESYNRSKRNAIEVSSRAFSGNTMEEFEEFRKKRLSNPNMRNLIKLDIPPSVANPEAIKKDHVVGCITGKESILISPIVEWTDKDVWYFLNEVMQVPHCSLYDEGWHRLGCIGCPMSNIKQKHKENERWPHVKRNWLKAIRKIRAGGGFIVHNYAESEELSRPRMGFDGGGENYSPEWKRTQIGQRLDRGEEKDLVVGFRRRTKNTGWNTANRVFGNALWCRGRYK